MDSARKFKKYHRGYNLTLPPCHQNRSHSLVVCFCLIRLPRYIAMVSKSDNRKAFISSAISFLRDNNFDGLNLGWEYPAHNGSPADDKERFTALVSVSADLLFNNSNSVLLLCDRCGASLSVLQPLLLYSRQLRTPKKHRWQKYACFFVCCVITLIKNSISVSWCLNCIICIAVYQTNCLPTVLKTCFVCLFVVFTGAG